MMCSFFVLSMLMAASVMACANSRFCSVLLPGYMDTVIRGMTVLVGGSIIILLVVTPVVVVPVAITLVIGIITVTRSVHVVSPMGNLVEVSCSQAYGKPAYVG